MTSLFTNVPLEKTIEIILKRIYVNKEITTEIPKQEMKELLILCTKNAHFTFNNETYYSSRWDGNGFTIASSARKHIHD